MSSNQQSFSVTMRSKRENLRNQIRKEQLQQIFKTKRQELMRARQQDQIYNVFKTLQQRIEKCPNDMQSVDYLLSQIKEVCQRFPNENKRFILIGSFFLKSEKKVIEFDHLIITEQNLLFSNIEEYAWCFGIYCSIVCSMMQSSPIDNSRHQLQRIDKYLSILIEKYWQSFKLSQKNIYIIQIYVICLQQFFYHFQNQLFFPINSFNSLMCILNQFYAAISVQKIINTRDVKIAITRVINYSIIQIKQKELYSNQIRQFATQEQAQYLIETSIMQKLMKVSAQVFYQNLVDISDQKLQCVLSIKIFCNCNPIMAGEFLFQKKYFKQYQYLIMNHNPKLRQILLSSINSILPFITNSRLIQFLDQSFHVNLTTVLRQTLCGLYQKHTKNGQKISSQILFYILRIFQQLLSKVQNLDKLIFRRVFGAINQNGFDDLIDSMGQIRYEQKIEEIWSNIVDTYYSEDMCEDDHEKQNHCNYQNYQDRSEQFKNKGNNESMGQYEMNYKRGSNNNEQFII